MTTFCASIQSARSTIATTVNRRTILVTANSAIACPQARERATRHLFTTPLRIASSLWHPGTDLSGSLGAFWGDLSQRRGKERPKAFMNRDHPPNANRHNGTGNDGLLCDFTAAFPMRNSTLQRG